MHIWTITIKPRRPRHLAVAAAGCLCCAVILAACGSSSGPSQSSGAGRYNDAVKYASCMRGHGLPSFPDPTASGGIHITPGERIDPFSPAFKQAQHACQRLLPGALSPGQANAQDTARLLALARCMRAHGITGFPDPVKSAPSSPAGFSVIFGRPGAFLAIPKAVDPRAPAFRRAAAACGFPEPG
jgi:hypothetical protein